MKLNRLLNFSKCISVEAKGGKSYVQLFVYRGFSSNSNFPWAWASWAWAATHQATIIPTKPPHRAL